MNHKRHLLEGIVVDGTIAGMTQSQHAVRGYIDDGCSKLCAIGQQERMLLSVMPIKH